MLLNATYLLYLTFVSVFDFLRIFAVDRLTDGQTDMLQSVKAPARGERDSERLAGRHFVVCGQCIMQRVN